MTSKTRTIATVCTRDCYDSCGLLASRSEDGRLEKVEGDLSHPVTAGLTCPRAAGDNKRLYRNRVQQPAVRESGDFQTIDWSRAMDIFSTRLERVLDKHGPEAVLLLDYSGNCGLLAGGFYKRLWNMLGVTRTDHAVCSRSGRVGIGLHYGRTYGVQPEDLVSRKLVVFWGFNAAVSAPHLWLKALQGRKQNKTIIAVVDSCKTRMAQTADLWIRPRPGSDVALALAVMRLLLDSGQVDEEFVNRRTVGFEKLVDLLSGYSLDRACTDCRLELKDIRALADLYGRLKPSATMIGIGLQKNDHGADQARAVALIPALVGIDRGFFYSNSDGWSMDLSKLASPDDGPAYKTVSQVALGRSLQQGDFKMVFISGTNPVVTMPEADTVRQCLESPETFTVIHETHWTDTARRADLVLPALTYLEKDDLVIPWTHPYVRLSSKVVEPVSNGKTEVELMRELAGRLQIDTPWIKEDPWQVLCRLIEPGLADGNWQDLLAGRLLKLKSEPMDSYQTPTGKIELVSGLAGQYGWEPVPLPQAGANDGRFVWITSATARFTHSQFQEVYGVIPDQVFINPADAAKMNINPADQVVLSNSRGRFCGRAVISDKVPPGVLWSPRQSRDFEGRCQNQLVPGKAQALGGGSRFNSTRVELNLYHTSG